MYSLVVKINLEMNKNKNNIPLKGHFISFPHDATEKFAEEFYVKEKEKKTMITYLKDVFFVFIGSKEKYQKTLNQLNDKIYKSILNVRQNVIRNRLKLYKVINDHFDYIHDFSTEDNDFEEVNNFLQKKVENADFVEDDMSISMEKILNLKNLFHRNAHRASGSSDGNIH